MICQYADCHRPAVGLYRFFPTGTRRALCRDCHAVIEGMGLVLTPVEGWVARAIRSELPTRVEVGR